jgi:hypothetical protein
VPVPAEYIALPQLQGRAVVEFELKNGPGTEGPRFNVDGALFEKTTLKMVVGAYSAPVTAGDFADLVQKGFYSGMAVQRPGEFVVQTGDPAGSADNGPAGSWSKPATRRVQPTGTSRWGPARRGRCRWRSW